MNYAETYNKCTYIRFVREAIIAPQTVARRYRRILRMVDGNVFKVLLPGRAYDIVDGQPVMRDPAKRNPPPRK